MRIRTLLTVTLAAVFILVIALSLAGWQVRQRLTIMHTAQAQASAAAGNVSGLLVLMHEYTLYAEARAAQQWKDQLAAIADVPDSSSGAAAALLPQITDEIRRQTRLLSELFAQIEAANQLPETPFQVRRKRLLLDLMLTNIGVLSESVERWSERLQAEHEAAELQFHRVTSAFPVAMLVLLSLLTLLLVRRVLQPLFRLHAAVEAVARGDLTAHSASKARDELGDLSRTFDAMAIDMVASLKREVAERQQAENKAHRLGRLYVLLSQCNHAIVHSGTPDELFQKVCNAAVALGGVKMAWVGLVDEATQMVRPRASCGDATNSLAEVEISVDALLSESLGPTGTAIREDRPYWCNDFANDARAAPWHAHGARAGWAASASLPLHANGRAIGALSVYSGEKNVFDEDIRKLLNEIATDLSFALDNVCQPRAPARAAELSYSALFNSLIEGFCLIEVIFDGQDRPQDLIFVETNTRLRDSKPACATCGARGRKKPSRSLRRTGMTFYGKVAVTGEPARFENEAKDLHRWFAVSAYRVGGPESRKVGVLVSDITARKQAARQLAESEARRQADMRAALEVQHQAALTALSLMEDAVAAQHRAEKAGAALDEQLDELRRWQQLTLGREGRILSVKKEVNDLLVEYGRPPRYPGAMDGEAKK